MKKKGLIIFFTGISGVGKTTLSKKLANFLQKEKRKTVTVLDGDEVRTWLSTGLGFSEADRKTNMMRVGKVAIEIARHGGTVICALIAPYESTRNEIKKLSKPIAHFLEIYVHAPLDVLEGRDVKGLYEKAKSDKSIKMSGAGDVYEKPKSPDVDIDSSKVSIKEALAKILKALPKA